MATYHVCDICGRDLPKTEYEIYDLCLCTRAAVRGIYSPSKEKEVYNNKLKIELCSECAEDVIKLIQDKKDHWEDII